MSFFILSKLFWLVAVPSHVVLWLALATVVLLVAGYRRAGERCAVATALLFILIGLLPTWQLLAWPLENHYPQPVWPHHVDGIVVLGGGVGSAMLASRGAPTADAGIVRIIWAYRLARRFPHARVIFSGGAGSLAGGDIPDTVGARMLFSAMGLDPKRLTLESKSRNTYQNLVYSRRLARPKPGEVWMLATSALHMPRAMDVARRIGWTMRPWPTDYDTLRHQTNWSFDIPGNLGMTDKAVHEWIGLAVYWITGRIA